MGSYGENRKQIHIFNKFDPCCFAGDLSKNYEDIIKDKLIILGKGHFDIDIDESNTKHSISKNTLTKIRCGRALGWHNIFDYIKKSIEWSCGDNFLLFDNFSTRRRST